MPKHVNGAEPQSTCSVILLRRYWKILAKCTPLTVWLVAWYSTAVIQISLWLLLTQNELTGTIWSLSYYSQGTSAPLLRCAVFVVRCFAPCTFVAVSFWRRAVLRSVVFTALLCRCALLTLAVLMICCFAPFAFAAGPFWLCAVLLRVVPLM